VICKLFGDRCYRFSCQQILQNLKRCLFREKDLRNNPSSASVLSYIIAQRHQHRSQHKTRPYEFSEGSFKPHVARIGEGQPQFYNNNLTTIRYHPKQAIDNHLHHKGPSRLPCGISMKQEFHFKFFSISAVPYFHPSVRDCKKKLNKLNMKLWNLPKHRPTSTSSSPSNNRNQEVPWQVTCVWQFT